MSGTASWIPELVKIRASQLNGCACCLDMHDRDAHKRGKPPLPDVSAAS